MRSVVFDVIACYYWPQTEIAHDDIYAIYNLIEMIHICIRYSHTHGMYVGAWVISFFPNILH